jgi:hypothetical protein
MTRRISALLGLLTVLIGACAGPAPRAAPPAEWRRGTFPLGSDYWEPSIDLPVPVGWARDEDHGEDYAPKKWFSYTDPTGQLELRYEKETLPAGEPLARVRERVLDALFSYDSYSTVDIRRASFGQRSGPGVEDGAPGVVWEFRYAADGEPRVQVVAGFDSLFDDKNPGDEDWITLSFSAPLDQYPALAKTIFWDEVTQFGWPVWIDGD